MSTAHSSTGYQLASCGRRFPEKLTAVNAPSLHYDLGTHQREPNSSARMATPYVIVCYAPPPPRLRPNPGGWTVQPAERGSPGLKSGFPRSGFQPVVPTQLVSFGCSLVSSHHAVTFSAPLPPLDHHPHHTPAIPIAPSRLEFPDLHDTRRPWSPQGASRPPLKSFCMIQQLEDFGFSHGVWII